MEPDNTMGDNKPDPPFPIVGIGASAGGLHSLECFLEALPKNFNFAIVFIQHLSPEHKSLIPEILRSKWHDYEFIEIEDGLHLLPGRLYLCPPAIEVRIHEGSFRVIARPDEHIHFPIDEFMVSLAEDAAERAIAVIFSGAGTDGVCGIQAVRTDGGTVFVQDPATAQFPELPQAAIKTGQVDSVLPPPDIAREIVKLLGSGAVTEAPDKLIHPAELEPFYLLIREKTGHRFNHYKKSVISRRIRRRMYLQGITSVTEYLNVVADKPGEAGLLASDLMIGVTSFFRDRLAWKALRIEVIRKLVVEDGDAPIRVWTPACATGEESYSIAMMLRHELDLAGKKRELQVFATDVNDRTLEKAREGKYPASISADVPQEFMREFFTYSDDGASVTVSKELRQHVIFAKQDILIDPPFSRLDLIICRNLLIYLEAEAQEKCITLFHYALRPGGCLFLGNAESPGRKSALFKSLAHKKCRVYEKVEVQPPSRLPLTVPFASERAAVPIRQQPALDQAHSVIQLSQDALLEKYGPAAVTINQNYDILYNNGPTNRYLKHPRGAPTQNLLDLIPENLRNRIRGAIYKVTREAGPVSIRAGIANNEGQKRQVSIHVSKINDILFLIVFMEKPGQPAEASSEFTETVCVEEPAVRQLEVELSATRQELQTNIEQLKSLNEEQQSSNEELQAANEELETSREELQSLNEELITVNTQLQSKVEEQEETNNDLNNFLGSTNIPTIFLDDRFRVKRYTPAITKLIKLIPSDVGRQIIDMSQELLGPDLITDAQSVLENLVPVKKEIRTNDTWYVRTALPYRTFDNRIEGVVVTYNDVTELKRAEERSSHLASFPQLNPNPVIEIDSSGKVTFCNAGALETLESLGMDKGDIDVFLPPDLDTTLHDWDKINETTLHRELIIKDRVFGETLQLVPQFDVVRLYAADITDRKRAEEEIKALLTAVQQEKDKLSSLINSISDEVWFADTQGRFTIANPVALREFGISSGDIVEVEKLAKSLEVFRPDGSPRPAEEAPPLRGLLGEVIRNQEEIVRTPATGELQYREVSTTPARDYKGEIIGSVSIVRNITQRKRAEEALRKSEKQYRELFENMIDGFAYCKMLFEDGNPQDFIYLSVNHAFETLTGLQNVVGKRVTEVIPGIREADPELFEIYGRVSLTGKPERFEIFVEAMKVWFSISVYSPEKEFFVAVFDVITDRKRAEEELRESKDQLAADLDAMTRLQTLAALFVREGDMRAVLDKIVETAIAITNADMGNIQLLDKRSGSLKIIAHRGFEQPYLDFWNNVAEDQGTCGTALKRVERVIVEDVTQSPIFAGTPALDVQLAAGVQACQSTPLVSRSGNPLGMFSTHFRNPYRPDERSLRLIDLLARQATEIIERAQTEEALRQGERRERERAEELAALLEAVPIPVIIVHDPDSTHMTGNCAADKLLRQTHGTEVSLSAPPEVRPGHFKAIRDDRELRLDELPAQRAARGEHVQDFEFSLVFDDGTTRHLLGYGTPLLDQQEHPRGAVHVLVDITDRKRAEEEIKRLNDDLFVRNDKLEFANKELESFIYSVSHDLRGPLRAISGFSEIMMKDIADKVDEKGKKYLSRIHHGTEKMSRLIDDLLNLSRISRLEIQRKSIDLSQMASSIIADLRETHPGRSAQVDIKKGLTVFADPGLIEIVLSNLLGNAWKFTAKKEHASIEFGTVEQDDKIIYYVRDNGVGFNQEYSGKMFWPFHRLHSESAFEGTGIGLAIVDRIISRHGGKVWAEGLEGKGATIYFSLT